MGAFMSGKWGVTVAVCAALASVGLSSDARAGARANSPVRVVFNLDGSISAEGSLMSTRQSPDAVQSFTCSAATLSSGTTTGHCQARSATNVVVACSTSNERMIDQMLAVGTHSSIAFRSNAQGECTYLRVTQDSRLGL
jgi:hypothetical protein